MMLMFVYELYDSSMYIVHVRSNVYINKYRIKGTVSDILSDPPCKDNNAFI